MWLILSLTSAFCDGLQNTYYKRAALQVNPILMAWSVLVVSGLFFSPLLLLGIPHLGLEFWIAVLLRVVIDSAAFTLFIAGVQKSPLSLTVPMLSISSVLSIGTVFLLSHLLPTPLGFLGILITISGVYLLHFDHDTKHLLSPFLAIQRERGVLYVTIAALLWSMVVALQKFSIDHSNLYFYTAFFQIFWAVCFTPIAYLTNKKTFHTLWRSQQIKTLLPGGILDALKTITGNASYVLALPAYANSVSRVDVLFSSFFGWLFFKEKLEKHAFPTLLIFMGVVIIALAQH